AGITLQVTNAIAISIPPHVDSFLRNYMSNNIMHVHPTQVASYSAQDLQDHEDHHDDDACLEGKSSAKRQKTSEHGTYSVDDDEVPIEEVSPKLIEEISGAIDEAQL
ncbi:hypothetical protein Tco_0181572, partial [Tanacetum coccineum]